MTPQITGCLARNNRHCLPRNEILAEKLEIALDPTHYWKKELLVERNSLHLPLQATVRPRTNPVANTMQNRGRIERSTLHPRHLQAVDRQRKGANLHHPHDRATVPTSGNSAHIAPAMVHHTVVENHRTAHHQERKNRRRKNRHPRTIRKATKVQRVNHDWWTRNHLIKHETIISIVKRPANIPQLEVPLSLSFASVFLKNV